MVGGMREYNARGARRAVARATRMDAPLLVQLFERAAEVLRLVLLREAFLRERGRWKGGETVDRGACFVRGARGEARTPGAASSATRREAYPRGDGIRRHLRTRAGPGAGSEEECTRPSEDVMFSRRRSCGTANGSAPIFDALTSVREGCDEKSNAPRAQRVARRPPAGSGRARPGRDRLPRPSSPSASGRAMSDGCARDRDAVLAREPGISPATLPLAPLRASVPTRGVRASRSP